MGCQLESQGAALKELQKAYAAKGVLLCGVDRIEHPYDVEDYLRHFDFSFPVFVDMCQESPEVTSASLGDVVILDRERKRARAGNRNEFEPVSVKTALERTVASQLAGSNRVASPPRVLRLPGDEKKFTPPKTAPEWSAPARLGAGKYPRIVAFGGARLLCLWVTGEVPQQQLEYSIYSAGHWERDRPVPAGKDAHAVAADVDTAGRPTIVWAQKDAGGYRIYLSALVNAEWRQPFAVSPPGNNVFRPDVFCLPSGRVVVAWYGWKRVDLRDYPNSWWRSIYLCEVVDNKPGVPRELAKMLRGSDDCWDPLITGTEKDLQVSWLRDENPPKLWASSSGDSGWSAAASVLRGVGRECRVQAASPVRSSGAMRRGLVFEMNSFGGPAPFRAGTQVYMVRRMANRWTEPVLLSSLPGRHVAPVGVDLEEGGFLFFWSQLPGQGKPATIIMRGASPGSEERSRESPVVTGEGSNRYPSATVDPSSTVWLAWQSEETLVEQAIYVSAWRASRTGSSGGLQEASERGL